jgi:hypothetical protein
MSGATIEMNSLDSGPAVTPEAKPGQNGKLSITTDPSPVAILVFDDRMNTVAEGVSPVQLELTEGLYMVRATIAGRPDLTKMARVFHNSTRSVHLSDDDPNLRQITMSFFSDFLDKRIRKLDVLPPQSVAQSARESEVKPHPFWVRFLRLTNWSAAEGVILPKWASNYVRGRAVLDIANPQQNVVFAQIAGPNGGVLNVALPPAGLLRPVTCQLVVAAEADLLTAHVRLSNEWANAAIQYMAEGYVEEAKQLVEAGIKRSPSAMAWLAQKIGRRFDDPSAMLIPRYLGLRTGEKAIFSVLGDSLLDLFQQNLSDGFVISAETYARQRNFKLAALQILQIKAGRLPLYTEGLSLLIHRVRELLDLDLELVDEDHRPSDDQLENLKELKRTLNKWAPYIDLNSPTVTFCGSDVVAPRTAAAAVIPSASDGWIQGPEPPKQRRRFAGEKVSRRRRQGGGRSGQLH